MVFILVFNYFNLGNIADNKALLSYEQNIKGIAETISSNIWYYYSDFSIGEKIFQDIKKLWISSLDKKESFNPDEQLLGKFRSLAREMRVNGIFVVLSNPANPSEIIDGYYITDVSSSMMPTLIFGNRREAENYEFNISPNWTEKPDIQFFPKISEAYSKISSALRVNPNVYEYELGLWAGPEDSVKDDSVMYYSMPLIYEGNQVGMVGVEVDIVTFLDNMKSDINLNEAKSEIILLSNDKKTGTINEIAKVGSIDEINSDHISFLKNLFSNSQFNLDEPFQVNKNGLIGSDVVVQAENIHTTGGQMIFTDNPFYLIGIMDKSALYIFTGKVRMALVVSLSVSSALLLMLSYVFSKKLSNSALKISEEINEEITSGELINLTPTGIYEFDSINTEVKDMSKYLMNTTRMLTDTLQISNSKIGLIFKDFEKKRIFLFGKTLHYLGKENADNTQAILSEEQFDILWNDVFGDSEMVEEYQLNNRDGSKSTMKIIKKIGTIEFFSIKETVIGDKAFIILLDETHDYIKKQQLETERNHDSLTGLLNRRAFEEKFEKIVLNGIKDGIMIMWDLDNLKTINDKYGHDMGDKYIVKAADIMRNSFDENNSIVSRIGGDEFLVFYFNYESADDASAFIEQIHQKLSDSVFKDCQNFTLFMSVSGGYAFYENGDDFISLKNKADEAMYHSKKNFKGIISKYV